MTKVIIDRFEGDFAIVELEGTMLELPRVLLPEAKEGDVVLITLDREQTARRKQSINELMNDLFTD